MRDLYLKSLLVRASNFFGQQEIVCGEVGGEIFRYTYQDLYQRVCQLANALEKLDVQEGDVVGTFGIGGHQHLETTYAIPMMGAVFQGINVNFPPDVVEYLVTKLGQDKVLFVDSEYVSVIEALQPKLQTVKAYIIMNGRCETTLSPAYIYDDLIAAEETVYEFPDLSEELPAVLGNTGGTTGMPKGVTWSHRNVCLHAMIMALPNSWFSECTQMDTVMIVLQPWYTYMWATQVTSIMIGTRMVVPRDSFSGQEVADLIQAERVTRIPLTTFGFFAGWAPYWEKAGYQSWDWSSLKDVVNIGAAAVGPMSATFHRETGVRLRSGFGCNENPIFGSTFTTAGLETLTEAEQDALLFGNDGLPAPFVERKVLDTNGKEVPHDGESLGELVYRGPLLIDGYYNDPVATAKALPDGWYHSGDMVTVDTTGHMHLSDRKQDLIVSRHGFVSPRRVEEVLLQHPGVNQAAVIGAADGEYENPLAIIEPKAGYELDLADLAQLCRDNLPAEARPGKMLLIDKMPITATFKLNKAALKQQYGR